MHLLEPFQPILVMYQRGESHYALKKNQRDLWATGFSSCVADLRLRAGKILSSVVFL
jgi:hypothetical protein